MAEEKKKLAVIILNWNGLNLLKQFLPTSVKYTTNHEVDLIIADNGSTDGSVKWIETSFPQVKIIKFEQNYGFAEGYNRAVRETHYPFSILLNNDVEVTSGWWQPILKFLEEHPDVSAVQPKIKSYRKKEYFRTYQQNRYDKQIPESAF